MPRHARSPGLATMSTPGGSELLGTTGSAALSRAASCAMRRPDLRVAASRELEELPWNAHCPGMHIGLQCCVGIASPLSSDIDYCKDE